MFDKYINNSKDCYCVTAHCLCVHHHSFNICINNGQHFFMTFLSVMVQEYFNSFINFILNCQKILYIYLSETMDIFSDSTATVSKTNKALI